MRIIKRINEMQRVVRKLKNESKKIGFVPTMGALHPGHLSLIRKCKKENDITVVSIFVNPIQFGPTEDYSRYPRPFSEDKKKLIAESVDYLFYPTAVEMYPEGYLSYVNVEGLSEVLCGKFRPGHFKGVTTVVLKLFNIIQPDNAYFGEKDYQQLVIIKKMVEDLNLPIRIVGCPIVREKDGLAISSRNTYLSESERADVPIIYSSLKWAREAILKEKVNDLKIIKDGIKKRLKKIRNLKKIEYIEIVEPDTLKPVKKIDQALRILVALWVSNTRLIDNISVP